MATLFNPHSVAVGSTSITGVQSISWSETGELIAGTGDDDTYNTFSEFNTRGASFTITTFTPAQAVAAKNLSDTLVASGVATGGGADQVLTILNASTGGMSTDMGRQGSSCTIPGTAYSSNGSTSPISLA